MKFNFNIKTFFVVNLAMCHTLCSTLIQNTVLSFTGHSGKLDMTFSEIPSWHPLERSEGDKVIFTVCRGSKIYDINNSDLLAGVIHRFITTCQQLIGWNGSVCVFVCESVYVFVILCRWVCVCVSPSCRHHPPKASKSVISTVGSANNRRHHRVVWAQ